MKNTKRILSGVWRLGRGTAAITGLVVMLALTVGLASTALAGTGIGARFDLGKVNVVNAFSELRGSVPGPMLTITNQHDGKVSNTERLPARPPGEPPPPGPPKPSFVTVPAPALGLSVRPGQTPITVNPEAGTAKNLSADELDGKDSSSFASATNGKANDADRLDGKDSTAFVDPTKVYSNVAQRKNDVAGEGAGPIAQRSVSCDPGDVALGGGGFTSDVQDTLVSSSANGSNGWSVIFRDGGNVSTIGAEVRCADLPPLR